MSQDGNVQLIGCGDKRLGWRFLKAMEEKLGMSPYNLLIPGPDACLNEAKHLESTVFFVQRFLDLTGFRELHIAVHEDCAGCKCSPGEHEANVWKMARAIADAVGFTGQIYCYIARRPAEDDFAPWEIVAINESKFSVAAE